MRRLEKKYIEQIPMRTCARINLSAIEHNFRVMKALVKEDTKICGVIKTNGYGHGALPIADLIEKEEYIWGFAVATAPEAMALRDAGITKPILILGYVFREHHALIVKNDIRCAVFSEELAEQLSEEAVRQGKEYAIHIAVDTGMSRIGLPVTEEAADLAASVSKMPGIKIEGMFTHFARADEVNKSIAITAMERYHAFSDMLKKRGVDISIRHISNSAGILELKDANLDMVRAGITIYGIYPSDEMVRDKQLRPAMELISHVSHVKTLPAGVPISYGGTFVTKQETRVATIPVGYGDGYPRALSSIGYVLISGKKAPILGRICMDQFMVDVTGMEVTAGEEAVLMGKSGDAEITVDELGALSGKFPYEFVCGIGERVPRVYTDDSGLLWEYS